MATERRAIAARREMITVVAVACLTCLMGCSGRLKTYPVNGKVRFKNGEPVKVGTIELKSRQQGIHARGTVDRDGSFTLTTYVAGDGAVEGKHDCVVVQFVMTEGLKGHRPSTIGVIDRRYNSYGTSRLTIDIEAKKDNEIVLEVEGLRGSQPDGSHNH